MINRSGYIKGLSDPVITIEESNRPILQIQQNQKLWESEHFLELFFAQCIEGIWFMEAEEPFVWDDTIDKAKALDYAFAHQHIVRVNDAMLRQYNADREQFMGLTLNDFFGHDLENARKMWRRIFDAGKLTCETCERRFRGSDKFAGDMIWLLGDYFCIYNTEGKMVGHFGAQRDITQRKLAEQGLRESEERYRFLTKNVADGIMVVLDNHLMFANDALIKMLGCVDVNQLLGKNIFSLIAIESQDRFRKMIVNFQEKGHSGDIFQTIYITREGRRFWAEGNNATINWNGKPAILCTIRDINDRKLSELAVREQAENLQQLNTKLRSSIRERFRFGNIIGKSPAMQKVYELIIRAAGSDANVVIYGESGTGKELVAQAIHKMSHRSEKALVPVNCHAISVSLMESEFFGHRKGAFTGAYIDKPGYLDRANGGDLFLDEVGDLDLTMQGKLLRAIEGGGYTPVGSQEVCYSNFRIIAATNKDMAEAVKKGTTREDFFYRVHIIPITLPPLRDRKEDIPLLVDHFTNSLNDGKKIDTIPGYITDTLLNYDWPGNVRELHNVLQRYLTVGNLDFLDDYHAQIQPGTPTINTEKILVQPDLDYRSALERFEKDLILKALNKTRWNRSEVTRLLGIPRRTLYHKIKKFGIN
jgi:PAS domain S-box-containing protein